MKARLTFLFIVISFAIKAQLLYGFVLDEHGQEVPFASVFLQNSSKGTLSNSKGYYQIKFNSNKDTLVFSAIGFLDKKIAIKNIITKQLNVNLTVEVNEVSTVVISDNNDFAKQIIKKVIKKGSENRSAIHSFSANAYVKVSLEEDNSFTPNTKDKLNFIEYYSVVHFSEPNKWMVEKLGVKDLSKKKDDKNRLNLRLGRPARMATKRKSTNPNIFFSNISDGRFNFYNNTLSIPKLGQTPYISPIGNLALLSYNYIYEGSFYEKEQLVHKIKVIPKRKMDALFSGMIYINDQIYNIAALELSLPSSALHFFKAFKVYQNYVKSDSVFLLNRQEFFYEVHRGRSVLHGSVYNEFSNYRVNIQHPKNTFSNNIRITSDSAYTRDSLYWKKVRTIPLKKAEEEFVKKADSIAAYQTSPDYLKKLDVINNKVTVLDVVLNGIDHYNREKGTKWIIDPLIKQVKFAGVGGYRHALGGNFIKTYKNKNKLDFDVQADYGFGNKDLLVNGKIKFTYLPKKFAQLRIGGGAKYQMLTYMQNIATIFSRSNFVRNDYLEIGHYNELFNGLFLDLKLKYMQRTSIDELQIAGWGKDFFGADNTPISFAPYNELNMRIIASYTPFQKYAIEPNKKVILGSKWPDFHVYWEQGIPDFFNAKINYQLLKIGISQNIKWHVFGTGKYAFWSGKYLNSKTLEYPNMTFFRGTDNYFFSHPIYTFQLLGDTKTALNEFIEFHYIHHFNGMLIKKIPLLQKSRLETVAGGGFLYINDGHFNHSEVYTGLEFPFKLWDTKFKLGAYYSVAYSNYSDLENMMKFGLNIYNPFTNNWAY